MDNSRVKVFSALVVDDNRVIRRVCKDKLARYGLETTTANHGQEAVNLFKNGATFNLVLTDKQMPIMDGIECTKELRSMNVDAVIVGMTTDDSEDALEEFKLAGLDLALGKPLDDSNIESIMQLLNQRF